MCILLQKSQFGRDNPITFTRWTQKFGFQRAKDCFWRFSFFIIRVRKLSSPLFIFQFIWLDIYKLSMIRLQLYTLMCVVCATTASVSNIECCVFQTVPDYDCDAP